jgi:hypothetical protein
MGHSSQSLSSWRCGGQWWATMGRFERAGATSVFNFMGRYEPSRAVNQSQGDDPVALGMVPYLPPGAESQPPASMPDAHQVAPAATGPPRDATEMALVGPGPAPPMPNNIIILDAALAVFSGREIRLTIDAMQTITKAVIDSYEQQIRDDVASLKMEYLLPPASEGQEVREANGQPALVPQVPGEVAPQEPEEPGQPATPHVQPVPPASGPGPMRGVQGRRPRAKAAASSPRRRASRPAAGQLPPPEPALRDHGPEPAPAQEAE